VKERKKEEPNKNKGTKEVFNAMIYNPFICCFNHPDNSNEYKTQKPVQLFCSHKHVEYILLKAK
jgi:hypothetical protein